MKFGISIIVLLTLISSTIADVDLISLFKNIYSMSAPLGYSDPIIEELSPCFESINTYFNECVALENDTYTNNNKRDIFCKSYTTSKCQKLYNESINVLNECDKLSSDDQLKVNKFLNDSSSEAIIACSKDENNNYCPIANLPIFKGHIIHIPCFYPNSTFPDKEEYMEAIEETCYSKSCSEAIKNSYGDKFYEEITNTNGSDIDPSIDYHYNLITTLKSDECIAKQNTKPPTTSDAINLSINSFLLIIIAIFLILISQ